MADEYIYLPYCKSAAFKTLHKCLGYISSCPTEGRFTAIFQYILFKLNGAMLSIQLRPHKKQTDIKMQNPCVTCQSVFLSSLKSIRASMDKPYFHP